MAPLPADLQDRRVEITGPTDAKMVINALNSGASLYMADFEDSNCPTWANTLEVGVLVHSSMSSMPCIQAPACIWPTLRTPNCPISAADLR